MRSIAYCKVAVSPIRKETKDASEIVSQLLFGELVDILEVHNQWCYIRTYADAYEGWVDNKQIQILREKEAKRWMDGLIVEHALSRQLEGPEGKIWITAGAFRPIDGVKEFEIGKNSYRFLDEANEIPDSICTYAKQFLNVPYLWGGKSIYGIDCSGLVQLIYRVYDFQLPRDAYQQAEHGMLVDFENRMAGDLAFFVNDQGRIHHVGMLMGKDEIIHAHGYVRVDTFEKEGITRKIDGVLSHKLFQIKRLR